MDAIPWLLVAWPLFALAMARHQRPLLGRELPVPVARALRGCAWALLGVGLAASIDARGVAQGPVFWGGSLVVTAVAWVLAMTAWPRAALAAASAGAIAAAALLAAV